MRTIAIVNQKGGCGKTTTAINLAALYAKRGLRTLLIDMDPQSHCAAGLGVPESRIEYSIGDALVADHAAPDFNPSALVWEVARNLHLGPSTVMLSALEAPGGGLHQLPDKDRRLERLLSRMADQYDRCLIDCPPTIGLLTFNAMRAARETLIPVETGFFALRGAEKQWNTIQRMITHIGRPIACHLLPTLHNPQSQLACNILAALRRQFAGQILPVVIHEDEALREAASLGQPVLEYAPESMACRDFESLADWLDEHETRPCMQIEIMSRGMLDPALVGEGGDRSALLQEAGRAMPGGTRAAELARRVHSLAARSAAGDSVNSDTATHTLAPPAQLHVETPPAVINRESRAVEIESPAIAPLSATPPASTAEPTVKPIIESTVEPAAASPSTASPDLSAAQAVPSIQSPEAAPSPRPLVIEEPNFSDSSQKLSHLYGVQPTSRGAIFVQPPTLARTLAVVGDFNRWSETANRMTFDEHTGVFQTFIELPPGRYQYRLVANGEWIADPHNPNVKLNCYGEPNSVLVVNE